MIVEIECYLGDSYLFGKTVSAEELKKQIKNVENIYDRDEDNFIPLMCRLYGYEVVESNDDIFDFTYDRDTEKLYKRKQHYKDK